MMMLRSNKKIAQFAQQLVHSSSSSSNPSTCKGYKVVVVGGGSAGISVASQLVSRLPKGSIGLIEPSQDHYYQPLWTLVGGGLNTLNDTRKETRKVIPKGVDWVKSGVESFEPTNNRVKIQDGTFINYDFLVVAMGITLDVNGIPGLNEGLNDPDSGVCSNYFPWSVERTFPTIKRLTQGNAVFTLPSTPIKCPGAPQKIMWLTDDYLRRNKLRDKVEVIFNTSLPAMFSVKKYSNVLEKMSRDRNIKVSHRTNLTSLDLKNKKAQFVHLDSGEKTEVTYEMIHVTPHQKASPILKPLADATGFVQVSKDNLRHNQYPNVFAIGDCSNLPCARTGAAVAAQTPVVVNNMMSVINGGKDLPRTYNGYSSCPLITAYDRGILAEFDYNFAPHETFPFYRGQEMKSIYYVKKFVIPFIYWNAMLKGLWNGPGTFRKFFRFGTK